MTTDEGNEYVERRLSAFYTYQQKLYAQALKEALGRIRAFYSAFQEQDEALRKQVEAGELDKKELQRWRREQFSGDEWEECRSSIALIANEANADAVSWINDEVLNIYAENYNYGGYLGYLAISQV